MSYATPPMAPSKGSTPLQVENYLKQKGWSQQFGGPEPLWYRPHELPLGYMEWAEALAYQQFIDMSLEAYK